MRRRTQQEGHLQDSNKSHHGFPVLGPRRVSERHSNDGPSRGLLIKTQTLNPKSRSKLGFPGMALPDGVALRRLSNEACPSSRDVAGKPLAFCNSMKPQISHTILTLICRRMCLHQQMSACVWLFLCTYMCKFRRVCVYIHTNNMYACI